jgi:16S rRNA (uracil1498-N3)-methyltransferase
MNAFYVPEITHPDCSLPPQESHHAIKVLRLSQGDPVQLFDGKGKIYKGSIQYPDPKKCTIRIGDTQTYEKWNYNLHIAISPPKKRDRLEFFLEKATEIGVDVISFLYCARSERDKVRMDRAEKIIIEAMKQSLNAFHPKVNVMRKLTDFLPQMQSTDYLKLLAHGDLGISQKYLTDFLNGSRNVLILIGPEGGFHPADRYCRSGLVTGKECSIDTGRTLGSIVRVHGPLQFGGGDLADPVAVDNYRCSDIFKLGTTLSSMSPRLLK